MNVHRQRAFVVDMDMRACAPNKAQPQYLIMILHRYWSSWQSRKKTCLPSRVFATLRESFHEKLLNIVARRHSPASSPSLPLERTPCFLVSCANCNDFFAGNAPLVPSPLSLRRWRQRRRRRPILTFGAEPPLGRREIDRTCLHNLSFPSRH